MIWSAVLVQTKGWQRSFHPSMKIPIAAIRSLTEVKVPRRMAWRVMIPKKISTMLGDGAGGGVKCRVARGLVAGRAFACGGWWGAGWWQGVCGGVRGEGG